MKSNKDTILEWMEYAFADLEAALELIGDKDILNKIVCYHCQQAAEKMMKAYLIALDIEIIKTHNLAFLNDKIGEIDANAYNNISTLNFLTNFTTLTRYPNVFVDIDKSEAQEAIDKATEVMNFF